VSIIGCDLPEHRIRGGIELFDMAAQGRIDAFFLSGGQIDGQANINLTGIGSYPQMDVRWSGAFGSGFLYFLVPRVILFRLDHSRRIFPEKVDFISSPGVSEPGVHRPGGPHALVTNLCAFRFQKDKARFVLDTIHPGHTLEEVRDLTGFGFDVADTVCETPLPDAATLAGIRGSIASRIANPYPGLARELWGIGA